MDTSARLAHPLTRKRVVIIGAGFGGTTAARCLHDVDVILIDRTNHYVFHPLLYQVATAALSPDHIAWPLRTLFRSQPNVRIVMDDVVSIDRLTRVVRLHHSAPIEFDALIVATGLRHAYFGHDDWESFAPGLTTMSDAIQLRERILLAFEEAERQRADTGAQNRLSFVIVGGGHTGVELAGALLDLGRKTMGPDYPHLRMEDLSITLVEARSRILSELDPKLSVKALAVLERMGVTVKLNTLVTAVRAGGVMLGDEWITSTNVIWTAGTKASPLLSTLGADQDSYGRVKVQPDLTIPQDPWIFVIGDAAHCLDRNGTPLPGIAPVAISQGRYVAKLIDENLSPAHRSPFLYQGRSMVVTLGRAQAVAQIGPFHVSGLIAWLLCCVANFFSLIGIKSPVRVMCECAWYYLTCKPGARLLLEQSAVWHNAQAKDQAGEMTSDNRNPLQRAASF